MGRAPHIGPNSRPPKSVCFFGQLQVSDHMVSFGERNTAQNGSDFLPYVLKFWVAACGISIAGARTLTCAKMGVRECRMANRGVDQGSGCETRGKESQGGAGGIPYVDGCITPPCSSCCFFRSAERRALTRWWRLTMGILRLR